MLVLVFIICVIYRSKVVCVGYMFIGNGKLDCELVLLVLVDIGICWYVCVFDCKS